MNRGVLALLFVLCAQVALAEHIDLFYSSSAANNAVQSGSASLVSYATNGSNGQQSMVWPSGQAFDSSLFPCAVSATLTGAGADDAGSVSIISGSGSASASRATLSAGAPPTVTSSGPFDPQTAVVSWSNTNKNGGMGLGMDITLSYGSRAEYVWDGSSCTKSEITNIRASTTTPPKDNNITVWCESSISNAAGVLATTNISGIVISPTGWNGNERAFTFNVSSYSSINVSCAMNGDMLTSLGVAINPAPPQAVGSVSGFTGTFNCTNRSINLSWQASAGASTYNVYVNNVLNGSTSSLWYVIRNLTSGRDYTFSVSAVKGGVEGSRSVLQRDDVCVARDIYLPPDAFQRAYFSRVAGRNVTAYWNDNGAVLSYQNFVYDFSSNVPEDAQYVLLPNFRQIIILPEGIAGTYWRRYTSALRVSAVPGVAFGGAIRGVQGYSSTTNTYTGTVVPSSNYIIIYGRFLDSGNSVRVGSVDYVPDFQSSTQINVPLNPRPAPSASPLRVVVTSSGMVSTQGSIIVG